MGLKLKIFVKSSTQTTIEFNFKSKQRTSNVISTSLISISSFSTVSLPMFASISLSLKEKGFSV